MVSKTFKISGDEIQRLVPGLGGAIASDSIMVHGAVVGCMERDEPRGEGDSGWAFTSGTETQEYLDDPSNGGFYELNTIANYDPDIIPFLSYPVGTRVCRAEPGQPLCVEVGPEEPPALVFLPPCEEHQSVALAGGWIVTPPCHLLRRLDEGSLILWRPGFTVYLDGLTAPTDLPATDWLEGLRSDAIPGRTDEATVEGPLTSFCYRLVEVGPQRELAGWYGFARVGAAVLHYVGYFDDEAGEALAKSFWDSVSHEQV